MPQLLVPILKRPREPVRGLARQGVAAICVLGSQIGIWIVLVAPLALPTRAGAQSDSPGSFDALVSAAAEARGAQDFNRAIQLTEHALKLNASWAEGWWLLGSMKFDQNNFAGAEVALSKLLAIHPDSGPALAMRGIAEYETGDFATALSDIQRAIALGAANNAQNGILLRYHEALLLTRNGRFDEALTDYGFFLKAGKSNDELLTAVGLAGLRVPLLPRELGRGQEAMYEAAGHAIEAYQSGDDTAARLRFQDFFERFPNVPWSHFLYGYLLYTADPAGALREWRREVQVTPDNATGNYTLAWALLVNDKSIEALPFAQKAESLEPDKAMSQMILGRALAETGDLDRGFAHLEEALKLDPGNLEVHFALAKADSLAGHNLDAQRERIYCLQAENNRSMANAQP